MKNTILSGVRLFFSFYEKLCCANNKTFLVPFSLVDHPKTPSFAPRVRYSRLFSLSHAQGHTKLSLNLCCLCNRRFSPASYLIGILECLDPYQYHHSIFRICFQFGKGFLLFELCKCIFFCVGLIGKMFGIWGLEMMFISCFLIKGLCRRPRVSVKKKEAFVSVLGFDMLLFPFQEWINYIDDFC